MLLTAQKGIAAGRPNGELKLPIRFSSINIDEMSVLENQIWSYGSPLGPPMLYKTQQTARVQVFTKQKTRQIQTQIQ